MSRASTGRCIRTCISIRHPNDPNFPFLDPGRRTVARFIWSRETVKDSFTSDSNAELKFATGPVAHKVLFGVDYRGLKERARSGFDYRSHAVRSLRAGLQRRRPRRRCRPNRNCGRASSGSTRRTRCGSDRGSRSLGVRQDYVTSNMQGSPAENTRRPPAAPR